MDGHSKNDNILTGGKRDPIAAGRYSGSLPLVTVITAIFNSVNTIENTISSVLNQNYPNIEHLIIDGGSTDGTVDVLRKYNDAVDYWISEPDKGIYDAFNKGINISRGTWIYFLGADDELNDGSVLQDIFSKPHESKMVYGDVIWGDTGKAYDGKFSKSKLYYKNICQQAIFYHRDVFRKIGVFDLKYPLLADWVFNMRAFASENIRPVYIDRIVARYSTGGKSLSNKDQVFARERAALIRNIFGMLHYLHFKSLHGFWRAIKQHGRS